MFHPVTDFDYAALERRLRELACLDVRMRFVLEDRCPGGKKPERFCHAGIADLVRHLDRSRKPLLNAPIAISSVGYDDDCWLDLEVALWWNDSHREQVLCFNENLPQRNGGSHLAGFHAALGRVIARYAQQYGVAGSQKVPIVAEDARKGLTAVVAVWMPDAEFLDRTRDELISPGVKHAVELIVGDRLAAWLDEHPAEARAILAPAGKAAAARAVCGFVQRPPGGRP